MLKRGTWLTAFFFKRWKKAEEATAWDAAGAVNSLWRKVDKFYLPGQVMENH